MFVNKILFQNEKNLFFKENICDNLGLFKDAVKNFS